MLPNTRVEVLTAAEPERAVVVKPRRCDLPLPGADWRIVRFDDGGKLCVHVGALRVAA